MKINDCDYTHSEQEFQEMWDLLVESYAITGLPHNWLFARLEDWKYGGNSIRAKDDANFFLDKVHLWRTKEGQLVGFCISEYGGNWIEIQIHPHYRHIEADMYAWIHAVWTRDKDKIETSGFLFDEIRQRLLKELGYTDTGDDGYMRRYDLSRDYPDVPLAAGFRIETMAQNRDVASHIQAVNSAFGRQFERAWFDSWSSAPSYSFDLDFLVASPAGKHAAFCVAWVDARNQIAEIDPIGTHADYQRRGFAKAVVTECFKRLRERGVRYAYIGSGPEPYVANRLYESLNPVARFQVNKWVKELT